MRNEHKYVTIGECEVCTNCGFTIYNYSQDSIEEIIGDVPDCNKVIVEETISS